MEQHFASLSKRQTMLLLTAVTFGGNECLDAFAHLPDEEAEILKHRANALLEIPRDKRIPLLVQEIKRLVTVRRRLLGGADPVRLAKVLSGERMAMVEVVLKALPSDLANAVRKDLPPRDPVKLRHEVRPDVLSIIRWKLEDALRSNTPQLGVFKFSDLLTLQQRELLTICDRMGARALATAMAGLPEEELATIFGLLPPDQRMLATRATEAGKTRKLTEGDSRTVLEMYSAIENPSAGIRSAGAQRLARACIAQSPEFAIKLIDRHPGELGRLLSKWVKEERNRPLRGDGGRADIVEQMERLSQRGIIDRPMRLPLPPAIRPAPAPSQVAISSPANAAVARPPTNQRQPVAAAGSGAPPQSPGPVPGSSPSVSGRRSGLRPRNDFMAEREARRAGASSARVAAVRGSNADLRKRGNTDPRIAAARVMRDGKMLPASRPPGPGTDSRKMTRSPALQEIPKRRDRGGSSGRPTSGLHKSPVIKGPKDPDDPDDA